MCRDYGRASELGTTLRRVSEEYELVSWSGLADCLNGYLLAKQGEPRRGIAQLRGGLTRYHGCGNRAGTPNHTARVAEILAELGDVPAALDALTLALAELHQTGARWCESELVRLEGELLLRAAGSGGARSDVVAADAEGAFMRAQTIARRQQAKAFELRAATSLARLWRARGQTERARGLLAETYGWFTEGHDTGDLRAAADLLATLG
jgi:adenylate cyclase